jgi:hypothetical protein
MIFEYAGWQFNFETMKQYRDNYPILRLCDIDNKLYWYFSDEKRKQYFPDKIVQDAYQEYLRQKINKAIFDE